MSTRLANPFQFLDVDRKDPGKKNMETRTEAFVEIYDPYTQVQAAEQSHRCLESVSYPHLTLPTSREV